MSLGVRCLLTDDATEACELARQLEQKNAERKRITNDMSADASVILTALQGSLRSHDELMSICLYEEEWHEGITGLLAGRLKETYGTPVVIFARAKSQQGDEVMLKGSARSIDGYHILDALKRVRNEHPAILEKFGGHAKAAGMSLCQSDLDTFRLALDKDVRAFFSNRKPPSELLTDGELQVHEFTLDNARLLRELAPWGQDFPAPSFDNYFRVVQFRVLKERHIKYTLSPLSENDGQELAAPLLNAIQFNVLEPGEQPSVSVGDRVHAVYELQTNEYRGDVSLQLQLQWLE